VLLLTALALPAEALVYSGNPNLDFRVDRPADDYQYGSVILDKIRINHCAGGYTDVAVNDTIDPVALQSVAIPAGDHCSVTFYWSSWMDITGPTYVVRYAQSTTTVTLSTEIAPKALTPYSVISGQMSGGSPWLMMQIN
jgi:hypothetical protein